MTSPFLSILILPLLLLSGCTTSRNHIFHGRFENIAGDGWIEEGTRLVGAISSTPGADNGRILTLSLLPDATFILWHPTNKPSKTLRAYSSNGTLRAWLSRIPGTFPPDPSRQVLDLPTALPLRGEMALRWRNDLDFHLHVDVRTSGTNSASLSGDFTVQPDRDFEPNLIWVLPAMTMGVGTTPKPRDPSEYTTRDSLASLDQQIDRLMKTRKRYRRVIIKNVDTGRAAEFFNRPPLLDKPGIQFDTFIKSNDELLLTTLKSFAAENKLRFRLNPISQDPAQSVVSIDLYGKPPAVTAIVTSLLNRAYAVTEHTPLEFIRLD